jgi:hypothetical protein
VKIADLASRRRRGRLSPLKAMLLQYLEDHLDEVVPYRDERLAEQLSMKVSAFSFTLWALHRDGLIHKQEVDGKVYFGSAKAIADLRAKLGMAQPLDPFGRAKTNLERIRARSGNINTQELLDAVRGPWE